MAVGSRGEVTAAIGASPETVDLKGRTLIPEFIDSELTALEALQ